MARISARILTLSSKLRAAFPDLGLTEAVDHAKALAYGADRGLTLELEEESEEWDGDCPAPAYLYCALVRDEDRPREVLASLGMIGVNSPSDPYLTIVKAQLFAEVLAEMDAAEERDDVLRAAELASRATLAG